jgi:hypothetical protein
MADTLLMKQARDEHENTWNTDLKFQPPVRIQRSCCTSDHLLWRQETEHKPSAMNQAKLLPIDPRIFGIVNFKLTI